MTGDGHVRFCESGRGRIPPATHLIGGRWGGDVHGVTDYMHRPGKPGGLSPSDLPAKLNQWPTSPEGTFRGCSDDAKPQTPYFSVDPGLVMVRTR
jgi:hypothetical protein